MAWSEGWGRCVRNVGARGSNSLTPTKHQPLCRKDWSLLPVSVPVGEACRTHVAAPTRSGLLSAAPVRHGWQLQDAVSFWGWAVRLVAGVARELLAEVGHGVEDGFELAT